MINGISRFGNQFDPAMMQQIAQDRFAVTLMGIFAAVALALAAVGIYGVLSYSVSQRVQEIGIRMALGARAPQVWSSVVGQGALVSGIGIVAGLIGAFALGRLMRSMVFGVSVTDPLVFLGVAVVLGAVAAASGYVPAWRAAKVDPMVALRRQ